MEHKSLLHDCYLSCVEVVKPKNLINKSIKIDIENTNVSFSNQDGEVKYETNYLQFEEIMIVGGGKVFNIISYYNQLQL
jgi:hypothetical protein